MDYSLRTTLYDSGKKSVKVLTSDKFSVCQQVQAKQSGLSDEIINPAKWSAEFPNLYTLIIELINSAGKTVEVINGRIGFQGD